VGVRSASTGMSWSRPHRKMPVTACRLESGPMNDIYLNAKGTAIAWKGEAAAPQRCVRASRSPVRVSFRKGASTVPHHVPYC
jgi:hypothetical protein